MAVLEPEAGFGLWPRVKAVTGWPESNEDSLGVLAESWRQAGGAFEAAGGQSLSPVRQAWGDDTGGKFTARAGQTLASAGDVGVSMAALTKKVQDFAVVVTNLKNGIRETIAVNDPTYGTLGLLPPPIAAAMQAGFAAQVTANVQTLIDEAAGQAGQAATTAAQGPPPLPAGPPSGASPQQNADWWRGLSPADRLRYINERPELVAGLDGLPTEARDDANRIVLDRTIADLQRQADHWRAEDRKLGRSPGSPPSEYELLARSLDERRAGLEALRTELGTNTLYDSSPDAAPRDDQKFYLLGFDNTGDGRAIVARGNPDIAANVATVVPGIMNDITTVARTADPNDQTLLERIDVLHRAAGAAGSPSTSVIGWLDYDAPSGEALLGTFSGNAADAARKDLESFQQGLRVSHQGGPSHNTLIGHSYGSLVAGAATRDGDLQINDFVAVGSLGVGTQHAGELRVPNVWVTEMEGDKFADLGVHGRDPSDIRFGAKVFESDPAPDVVLPGGSHSGAFDDVPGNVGLDNLARIIATRDNSTYPEVLHRVPVEQTYPEHIIDYDPP